MKTPRVV